LVTGISNQVIALAVFMSDSCVVGVTILRQGS
jgi:hypothetical protein